VREKVNDQQRALPGHYDTADRGVVRIEVDLIQALDSVVLTAGLPEYGLGQGNIGAVVLVPKDGKVYEGKCVILGRETVAVVSLFPIQVCPIGNEEIVHARRVQSAPRQG